MGPAKDKYGRVIDYLRISVTDRCNLRCIYCMPADGVRPLEYKNLLSYEEITRLVTVAARLGVRKVRITGGEPLARKNLPFLIGSISEIEGIEDISLTTNGTLLKELAGSLASAGLTRVNVSLDSLHPDRYRHITRGGDIYDVLDGIAEAQKAGLLPVKINMIPMRGINDDEVEEFARLMINTPLHVRFIECMPTGARDFRNRSLSIPTEEIKERVTRLGVLTPVTVRKHGPARYFRFENAPGVLGFISPVTHHFCESCNRLRLTSDGKLRPCLFSEMEIDVKEGLRSGAPDSEIERLLRLAVVMKPEGHGLDSELSCNNLRPMSRIGG